MKRMLTVLGITVCLMALCVPALAANGSDMVSICVRVPDDWGTPYLYSWTEDSFGNVTYLERWPGVEMGKMSDGWYYTYIPSDMDMVIVSVGSSILQTEDLDIRNGTPAWITVGTDASAEIYYTKQNSASIPPYLYTIHVSVPKDWPAAYVWAWSNDLIDVYEEWPGEKMKTDADGYYTAQIPTWAPNLLIAWSDSGVDQTLDLAVSPQELWIVVDGMYDETYYTATVYYEDPNPPAQNPTEPETQPTEPEVTQPPETLPPETLPAETEPEATIPPETVPETTEPAKAMDPDEGKGGGSGITGTAVVAVILGIAIAGIAIASTTKKRR